MRLSKEKPLRSVSVRRVLGIDPGLSSTGYAVVDYAQSRYHLAASGVVSTKAGEEAGARLCLIYDAFYDIIKEYAPREAGMESLFFSRNVTSALGVSEARGALLVCLHKNGVALTEYMPNAIKKAVTGSARADKRTVQEFVKILLGLDALPKTDHEADAIACALAHIHCAAGASL